jgi:hypothetical protein
MEMDLVVSHPPSLQARLAQSFSYTIYFSLILLGRGPDKTLGGEF